MNRITIPVVFSTDFKYLVPTSVAIISMLENAEDNTFYNIFILAETEEAAKIKIFVEAIDEKYDNCIIEIKCIDKMLFQMGKIQNEYLSIATYYRLIIAELLSEYERCLYLDGDILVLQDLKGMYFYPMEENYLLGVKAWNMYRQSELTDNLERELGVPIISSYINAGVLLMNLEKMRKDELHNILMECIGAGYRYEDQDILNQKCWPYIGYLEERYNIYSLFYKAPLNAFEFMDELSDSIKEYMMNPAIIHFSGMYVKPWENRRCKGAKEWFGYLHKVGVIEKLYYDVNFIQLENFIQKWDAMQMFCSNSLCIYIWGYTKRNIMLKRNLLNKGINICGFIDNASEKWGNHDNGECVFPVESVVEKDGVGIIITNVNRVESMKKQANELGVPEKRIWIYEKFEKWYYMGLSPLAYEEELDDILKIENINIPEIFSSTLENKVAYLREDSEQWNRLSAQYEFSVWLETIVK